MVESPSVTRTWIALASAIVLAVSILILWPKAPKQDDGVALAQNLARIRSAIGLYRQKHDHGPATLEELTEDGHLRYVPVDPITKAKDWHLDTEETVRSNDFSGKDAAGNTSYILDVHSSAPGKDASGKAYSEY
jgi:general secretion pathway protein G